jgi:hypothetical protein
MPFHPTVEQLIRRVEALSGKPVHVGEDPSLQVMAVVTPARGVAPAHFLRYRPGVANLDYLIAYQLGFVERQLALPLEKRMEVVSFHAEIEAGIAAMGLRDSPPDFARSMISNIVTQVRSYAVGCRIDDMIRNRMPELRAQQESAILAQLAENGRALAPEIREKLPKPLVDANTVMNAALALIWSERLGDPRHAIPFRALGCEPQARRLLEALETVPAAPEHDPELITRWAEIAGVKQAFHFEPQARF